MPRSRHFGRFLGFVISDLRRRCTSVDVVPEPTDL
jgi:hypothetical protein